MRGREEERAVLLWRCLARAENPQKSQSHLDTGDSSSQCSAPPSEFRPWPVPVPLQHMQAATGRGGQRGVTRWTPAC